MHTIGEDNGDVVNLERQVRVRNWPKIVSHFYATGVRCGHFSDPHRELASVRFRVTFDELRVAFDEAWPARTPDNRLRSREIGGSGLTPAAHNYLTRASAFMLR